MVKKRYVAEYKDCGVSILSHVPTRLFVLIETKFPGVYTVLSTLVALGTSGHSLIPVVVIRGSSVTEARLIYEAYFQSVIHWLCRMQQTVF